VGHETRSTDEQAGRSPGHRLSRWRNKMGFHARPLYHELNAGKRADVDER
jgi:hypothetical protein